MRHAEPCIWVLSQDLAGDTTPLPPAQAKVQGTSGGGELPTWGDIGSFSDSGNDSRAAEAGWVHAANPKPGPASQGTPHHADKEAAAGGSVSQAEADPSDGAGAPTNAELAGIDTLPVYPSKAPLSQVEPAAEEQLALPPISGAAPPETSEKPSATVSPSPEANSVSLSPSVSAMPAATGASTSSRPQTPVSVAGSQVGQDGQQSGAGAGPAATATFMEVGSMLNTLVRLVMGSLLSTGIETPDAFPESSRVAVEENGWEVDYETGLLRDGKLGTVLMGYEDDYAEGDAAASADIGGGEGGRGAEEEEEEEEDWEEDEDWEDENAVELGGPVLFVRGPPTPLPDPFLFAGANGSGKGGNGELQVAPAWLQPFGWNPIPGKDAADSETELKNVEKYRHWGSCLAAEGKSAPHLGIVLFPTAGNGTGSLTATTAFLAEVWPILWGLGLSNIYVDEQMANLLADTLANSVSLAFLSFTVYIGFAPAALLSGGRLLPAIGASQSLRVLGIPGRFLGEEGTEALAEAMMGNSSVVYLMMGRNAPVMAGLGTSSEDDILGETAGVSRRQGRSGAGQDDVDQLHNPPPRPL